MTSAAEQAALRGKANSVTHKQEYDKFIRDCAKRGNMPKALMAPFRKDKTRSSTSGCKTSVI